MDDIQELIGEMVEDRLRKRQEEEQQVEKEVEQIQEEEQQQEEQQVEKEVEQIQEEEEEEEEEEEPSPVAMPRAMGKYHITQVLDPATVVQQIADREGIPLSVETVDHLIHSATPSDSSYSIRKHDDDDDEKLEWWFMDSQGFEKGPFASSTMRAWWDNGFFTESIIVKYQQQGPWCPLNRYYSEMSGRSMEDVFVLPPVMEYTRKEQRGRREGEKEKEQTGNRDQENPSSVARKVRMKET